MSAGHYNATIEQGATFHLLIEYKDSDGESIDLTGYTALMQIRDDQDTLTFTLSSQGGTPRITLGGITGTITLDISATDTATLNVGTYRYDLFLTSGATKIRLIKGAVVVSERITE